MPKKPRQETILHILEKQGFATVKELIDLLDYSSATINRDLNDMEKRGLVKRVYGGVEPVASKKFPPLPFRYDLNKKEKRHIGKAAASLVEDGDTVFIDASTTASYMGHYLTEKKDLHVITNNMPLAIQLSEAGVRVTVTGGSVIEPPGMLAGDEAVENASHFRADKMFFSTGGFTEEGEILDGNAYFLLHRVMMQNAKSVYFLADASKLGDGLPKKLCDFAAVSHVISDHIFPCELKTRYKDTVFLEATGLPH